MNRYQLENWHDTVVSYIEKVLLDYRVKLVFSLAMVFMFTAIFYPFIIKGGLIVTALVALLFLDITFSIYQFTKDQELKVLQKELDELKKPVEKS